MIKLLNKRMAIKLWAEGNWVYVRDTNPDEAENCGAGWYRMNSDGEVLDSKGEKCDIDCFGPDEEYFWVPEAPDEPGKD